MKDDGEISQEVLDGILSRALAARPNPGSRPPVAIHRILYHRARVSDFPSGALTSVSVYDEVRKSGAALGDLVSARRVGPLVLRLVRGLEGDSEVWRIVETDTRHYRVVLLTYSSDGDGAHGGAARYAANATEADLTSDFNLEAHFFGERRLPRGS